MSSNIQHKILNYEVTPPPGVWDKIAAELDESELHHSFPSKLYEAEVTAPAGMWNKIQTALGENELIAPKRRAIAPWMRYAAAAVVIGLVAWGALQFINNKKNESDLAEIKTVQPIIEDTGGSVVKTDVPATIQPVTTTDKADEARNDAALEYSKKTYAKLDMPSAVHKLSNIAAAYSFASNSELSEPDENYVIDRDPADINSRYILLMTPDGHCVRIAKKLSNMVCCVSGEEQDKDCVDQMTNWKSKMACSPTGHSTGSFLDILSLIKSLDEQ